MNEPQRTWPKGLIFGLILIGVVLVGAGLQWVLRGGHQFNVQNNIAHSNSPTPRISSTPDPDYALPPKDDDRLNVLLLGIRGKDDPDGGLLTDTIMILSYDTKTKKSSLVSVPRDLYVKIDGYNYEKINAAYERLGNNGVKDLFSRVTGTYIDKVVVADFNAFKDLVDSVGGIDINLAKPFEEKTQWGFSFSLPAGPNHLDGQTALTYVRSRFSSSDFDRARRQQEVIDALKKKLVEQDYLSSPTGLLQLFNIVHGHINTDFNLLDIQTLWKLLTQINTLWGSAKKVVLSTSNYLAESRAGEAYVLVPKSGNLQEIQDFFETLLQPKP